MAVAFTSASTTADVAVSSSQGVRLLGWSIRESATTAAVATVILRNGDADSDQIVAQVELAGDTAETVSLMPQGVYCNQGIFVERAAGTTTVVVYTE